MALIQCDFFSDVLGMATSINVILPQDTKNLIGKTKVPNKKYPVLYLLHGLSDDHTIWERRTSIERYVEGKNLVVIMPNAGRSFYTNMARGYKYWTFISEELPVVAKSFFPISDKRNETFVAGLSMGGYGALKLALRKPEAFCAAASLSGALDIEGYYRRKQIAFPSEYKNIFGSLEKFAGSENDLFSLALHLFKSKKPKPKLYMCCGTEDSLFEGNVKFFNYLKKLNFNCIHKWSTGNHNWAYWDENIQNVLNWLLRK